MTRLGVTGHQRLDNPEAWPWVAGAVRETLVQVPRPVIAITSLAIGTDQLVAQIVIESGGSIHAVLPFEDVERSFAPWDLPEYRELVKQAAAVEVLNTPGDDEDAYLAAGRRVVELSDLIIAVWNALPAKGKGGTADIVGYAQSRGLPIIHINPLSRTVQQPQGPKKWL